MWRTHWTALTSNGRPMPVLNPAAFNSATSSWLVNVGPRWTMNSVALLGVRVVTYWGGGRRVTMCSLAPERHRIPIQTSAPATCDVKVTSATSVRINRLRSLAEVEEAAHNAGRSTAIASNSARGGSLGTAA